MTTTNKNAEATTAGASLPHTFVLTSTVTFAKSADHLAFRAVDAITHLRDAMQAYEGLAYMVSCSADHALPQPETLGAIIRASNEAVYSRIDALDSALSKLRVMLKSALPEQGRA
ncbi:MAG: hypothetical protein RSD57_07690 [Comamonas sp.]